MEFLIVIKWLFLIELLNFSVLPITFKIFRNLKDKGYGISKTLSVLIISYFSWLLSVTKLFSFDSLVVLVSLLIIVLISSITFFKDKKYFIKALKEKFRIFLLIESIFIIFFLILLFIRIQTPEIYGLEKGSDFSLINSILRGGDIFPLDSWFSGETINYYYFGHMVVAVLTKFTGITSNYTFNLSVPLFYSLTVIGIFSITYNLTKKIRIGLLGILLACLLSNSFGLIQLTMIVFPSSQTLIKSVFHHDFAIECCLNSSPSLIERLRTFPMWSSIRVIPWTITEYPYSTFLLGELHPHANSFPFQILALATIFNLFISLNKNNQKDKKYLFYSLLLTSLTIGSLFLINSWDYPIYMLLLSITIFFQIFRNSKNQPWIRGKINSEFIKEILLKSLALIIIVGITSIILFIPYHLSVYYVRNFGLVELKDSTYLHHFIIIFIAFLFPILLFLVESSKYLGINHKSFILFFFILGIIFLIITRLQISLILFPIIITILAILFKKNMKLDGKKLFVLFMILTGCLAAVFPDIFYIDSRYNNLFRFYIPVWFLWSISAAFCIDLMRNKWKNKYVNFLIIFFIVICLITTVFVTYSEHLKYYFEKFSKEEYTLDGTVYINSTTHGGYEAIKFLNGVDGTPIILEAPGTIYWWESYISVNTGLPEVMGWSELEKLRRPKNHEEIEQRINDTNEIYNGTDIENTISLLEKYNVSYIIVGFRELERYDGKSLEKFENESFFEKVFEVDDTRIYYRKTEIS